jgi:hypothetical protein
MRFKPFAAALLASMAFASPAAAQERLADLLSDPKWLRASGILKKSGVKTLALALSSEAFRCEENSQTAAFKKSSILKTTALFT